MNTIQNMRWRQDIRTRGQVSLDVHHVHHMQRSQRPAPPQCIGCRHRRDVMAPSVKHPGKHAQTGRATVGAGRAEFVDGSTFLAVARWLHSPSKVPAWAATHAPKDYGPSPPHHLFLHRTTVQAPGKGSHRHASRGPDSVWLRSCIPIATTTNCPKRDRRASLGAAHVSVRGTRRRRRTLELVPRVREERWTGDLPLPLSN